MAYKLLADIPAGCQEGRAAEIARQISHAFDATWSAVDLAIGAVVLDGVTLEEARARGRVVAACGADFRVMDDGGLVESGRAAAAEAATTLGVGDVGGGTLGINIPTPAHLHAPGGGHQGALAPEPALDEGASDSELEFIDARAAAKAPPAGGSSDVSGYDRLELMTLDGTPTGDNLAAFAPPPAEPAKPAPAPQLHDDVSMHLDEAPATAPVTSDSFGDAHAFMPDDDAPLELDTEALAKPQQMGVGTSSAASSPALEVVSGEEARPDASAAQVGRSSRPSHSGAVAVAPRDPSGVHAAASSGARQSGERAAVKRVRPRPSARTSGFLLLGGKLRHTPRTRVAVGFALALVLGSIAPLLHASSVMSNKVAPQLKELSRARAHGSLLRGRPGYRPPDEIEAAVSSMRWRHGIYTFLIWFGATTLLGAAWFRFT